MLLSKEQILIKYWGFNTFRPLQEEVINSIIKGNDTLALMPTGGGKSVCFQIPALMKEGLCLVITPLISLMKDQVDFLKSKGIKALYVNSYMHRKEIDYTLDECVFNKDVKFLYIAPERLTTEIFRIRVSNMNINLIAVDEAHCISHWGYDFRPSYLKIAELRDLVPRAPILALTATATPDVLKDIMSNLKFKHENIFKTSFERKNLVYQVYKTEDKLKRLLNVLNEIKGSGIIYARTRKSTKEIFEYLLKNKIAVDYYHAGLDIKVRNRIQSDWMHGKKRVIVATNAFGMGINKSNVSFVIHYDFPDSIEAYYQEAGRAGRDGNISYPVILYNDNDIAVSKFILESGFPTLDEIRNIYDALGNYFQLAIGAGKDVSFDFEIGHFSEKYNFNPVTVFNSIKYLEKENYLIATDSVNISSKILFTIPREQLYDFQIANKYFDNFIKLILRSYMGLFTEFTSINEYQIAQRAGISKEKVAELLNQLNRLNVITYVPAKAAPQIIYNTGRVDSKEIFLTKENYYDRKELAISKLNAIINYIQNTNKCRSQLLVSYFGETNPKRCGICDVCKNRNSIEINKIEFDNLVDIIKPHLLGCPMKLDEILHITREHNEDKIIKVIRWLIDNNKIKYTENEELRWNK
ncbi:MAG: ATP-dependent DNA helicase RecQ [Bacteroidota bacterium]|nr:ATP-dependent DNA helicase RecQ [Bacteroidota bacterium]